jgi:nucleotide-binding universal stress UspA family protein
MKILVAYDGSEHSNRAVKEAIDIARKFESSIELVHCSWDMSAEDSMALLKTKETELKNAGIKYKLRDERWQYPGERLVKIVNDEGFGLVVMGTRGLGLAKSIILGSVSSHVIDKTDVPVLVVK